MNGRPLPIDGSLGQRLPQLPPVFVVDGTNKLRQRVDFNLNPSLSPTLRNQIQMSYSRPVQRLGMRDGADAESNLAAGRYLADADSNVVAPRPRASSKSPKSLTSKSCAPIREHAPRTSAEEAVVSIAGRVKGRGPSANFVDGDVSGKFAFDVAGGFISQAIFKISSEDDGGGLTFIDSFDIDLTRAAGNPLGLAAPEPKKNPDPGPQAKGKMLLNQIAALAQTDPMTNNDPNFRNNSRFKLFPLKVEAGREYLITLNSNEFDPYLIVQSPAGQKLAEDDDGGGFPNARSCSSRRYPVCIASSRPPSTATSESFSSLCKT